MVRIVRREQFSDETFLWEVEAPDVARAAQPGHFVMLRLDDAGERIPLTVADFDRARGTITVVVQALGKTTRQMRDGYEQGDEFADFAGPLGLPQHIERVGHVVMVGGGLGVAPIFPQLRAFRQAGCRVTCIVGFRDAGRIFWTEKLAQFSDELILCTDDGSAGRPGFVDGALRDVLASDPADLVVAIGPMPMMHACAEASRPFGVRTMVSLNTVMVDGTGMCGSCRVSIGGEVKFACVDGPDFDGHAVDFKELLARQKRFKQQEQQANDDHAHVCNLEDVLVKQGKRTYKKFSALERVQVKMPERDATERAGCFEEVNLGYSQADALREAERCIQCKNPTCIEGCPVRIDIPTFIRHLMLRDLEAAVDTIHESSPFPSVCGRVCPQESQCEAQCVLVKAKMEPVAIGRLERFVGDHAKPRPVPAPASKRKLGKVAIVGSGPGGLAAAADLVKYGTDVTVFEALHVVGGVLRYGIPSFRLPRDIIDREVQQLRDAGVKVQTNKVIGKTFTIEQLTGEMGFDAVFVAAGAGAPAFLGIPGENAGQVYSANEFLTRINLMGGDRFPYQHTPVSVGQRVIVIGAGNTAMDCLRVARRLGAAVRCVYRRSEAEAPARVEELRHAREEGVEFSFLHGPVEILLDEAGDVRALKAQKMTLGEPDERGRRTPQPLPEWVEWPCDTVIYALGTKANPIIGQATRGLALDKRGYIVADEATQSTNLRGVFAGGDIVTGGATVILAMAAGRRAARAIAAWLQDGKRSWPMDAALADSLPAPSAHAPSEPVEGAPTPCPKCHEPLADEDEGPYVCCADAPLQWQCATCSKVSEGFAFPHGCCPACGGKLTLRCEPGEASADEAMLTAVRMAFEVELGGRAFYRRAAADTDDGELRALFGRLATMEDAHIETLSRRYHVKVPHSSHEFSLATAAIFAGVEHRSSDPENLYRLAIALEKRAAEFFATCAANSPAGSAQQRLYLELGAEECDHMAFLATEHARWRAKMPGLLGGSFE